MDAHEFAKIGQALFPTKFWQSEVAELLGVTQRTVYRWSDDKDPQNMSDDKYLSTLIGYAKVRKTDIDSLIYKLQGYKNES